MRIMLVLCSDGLQGGHGEEEVDANLLPFVCHRVIESIHKILYIWHCAGCSLNPSN